jgi:hypothetical protein
LGCAWQHMCSLPITAGCMACSQCAIRQRRPCATDLLLAAAWAGHRQALAVYVAAVTAITALRGTQVTPARCASGGTSRQHPNCNPAARPRPTQHFGAAHTCFHVCCRISNLQHPHLHLCCLKQRQWRQLQLLPCGGCQVCARRPVTWCKTHQPAARSPDICAACPIAAPFWCAANRQGQPYGCAALAAAHSSCCHAGLGPCSSPNIPR